MSAVHTLAPGDEIVTAALTVTEAHVVMWSSLTGDWVPLHTDAVTAAESEFGERVAHGPLTMALALGLVTQQRIFDGVVLAWLGVDKVRALAPVRFGDTIAVHVRVAEVRASRTGGRDVCVLEYSVRNQEETTVMTFTNALLLRGAGRPVTASTDGAPAS